LLLFLFKKGEFMQQVIRKEKESFENLIRRFNRKVHQSGNLAIAKKRQFFEKPPSKRKQREAAIRKAALKEKKARQIIMGL